MNHSRFAIKYKNITKFTESMRAYQHTCISTLRASPEISSFNNTIRLDISRDWQTMRFDCRALFRGLFPHISLKNHYVCSLVQS